MGRKKCPHVEIMEKSMCAGAASVCPEVDGGGLSKDDDASRSQHCAVTSWSDWSPCSVSCG